MSMVLKSDRKERVSRLKDSDALTVFSMNQTSKLLHISRVHSVSVKYHHLVQNRFSGVLEYLYVANTTSMYNS